MTVEQIMELATILGDRRLLATHGINNRDQVQDAYKQLRTAIEELHRDANRYNWLKDQHAYHYSMSLDSPAECGVEFQWQQGSYEERDWGLNDAIDNEIEREIDTAKEST